MTCASWCAQIYSNWHCSGRARAPITSISCLSLVSISQYSRRALLTQTMCSIHALQCPRPPCNVRIFSGRRTIPKQVIDRQRLCIVYHHPTPRHPFPFYVFQRTDTPNRGRPWRQLQTQPLVLGAACRWHCMLRQSNSRASPA